MQKRGFLLLLGMAVLLVAAAVYAATSGERAERVSAGAQRMFPELAARVGDLAWMRVVHGSLSADFAAIGGDWVVVEKGNYPAAPGRMRSLLRGLADLALLEPKTRRPELWSRLDLDDPKEGRSTLVMLQSRTGATVAELLVGKTRGDRLGGTDGVYVRRPGEDQTWLARGSFDLPGDIAGWLDRRIIDIPQSRVASLTLTAADGARLELRRDAPERGFRVVDAPSDAKLKPDQTMAAPAAALTELDLADVRPAAELPSPSRADSSSFQTFDGLTIALKQLERDKADWIVMAASGTGTAAAEASALNARFGRWAYAIPADRAKLLRTRLADVLEPEKGS